MAHDTTPLRARAPLAEGTMAFPLDKPAGCAYNPS